MKTIQKRADELKSGDVFLPCYGKPERAIALVIPPSTDHDFDIEVWRFESQTVGVFRCAHETPVYVESPGQLVTQEQLAGA